MFRLGIARNLNVVTDHSNALASTDVTSCGLESNTCASVLVTAQSKSAHTPKAANDCQDINSSFIKRPVLAASSPTGIHPSDEWSTFTWDQKFRDVIKSTSRLLPLPLLAPPRPTCSKEGGIFTNSSRIKTRHKKKHEKWKLAVGAAFSCGWLYRAPHACPFRRGPAILLCDMETHHRQAWEYFLKEATGLRDARRRVCVIGVAALEAVLKRTFYSDYASEAKASTYVPLIAELIAEPSKPEQCVHLLDALPESWAEHYASEATVLQGGGDDQVELDLVRSLSKTIGGTTAEYIKYFRRPDAKPLWTFLPVSCVKAFCSFKAVMKKDMVHQRKILATLEKNYRWGPPPRTHNLGLFGGASLAGVLLEKDQLYVSVNDQENCFTYVATPAWFYPYHAAPPLQHHEFGGPAETGLWQVGLNTYISPCYKRLAMGSTHSVDLICNINNFCIGQCLTKSSLLHEDLLADAGGLEITSRPKEGYGYVWEFFSGLAGWTNAMVSEGFGSITPIDSINNPHHDLTNVLFLEKVFRVIRTGIAQVGHLGTPCSSMSRSITPPWRSVEFPEGFTNLNAEAMSKVSVGNVLTRIAALIIHAFNDIDACVSDENPERSWHWVQPVMIPLIKDVLKYSATLDYCAYGMPWKKQTRIRCNREWIFGLSRICPGHTSHTILRGKVLVGNVYVSRTSIASAYPPDLVLHWAFLINKWWFTRGSTREPFGTTKVACTNLNMTGQGPDRFLDANSCARYSHIDDHAVVGVDSALVGSTSQLLASSLKEKGFVIGSSTDPGEVDRYIGYASQTTPARWLIPHDKLVLLYEGIGHFLSASVYQVGALRALIGVLNWAFLLRRPMLSIFHAVYYVLTHHEDYQIIPFCKEVRNELSCARRLLYLSYADLYRTVAPVVFAQDAEGSGELGHGGWGIGWARPPSSEVVALALRNLGKGVPREDLGLFGCEDKAAGYILNDNIIPQSWTDGTVPWFDLLARSHSYYEHINLYESRVLCRSFEIASKVHELRRSRILALEDNQVTSYVFSRGRSKVWSLNGVARRRVALELASDCEMLNTWVQTKRMPMDALSRDRIVLNVAAMPMPAPPGAPAPESSR